MAMQHAERGLATRGGTTKLRQGILARAEGEGKGKRARRVRYPRAMLMPAVEVNERRRRAGIGAAQSWKTRLLHSNSRAHRVEAGSFGLEEAPGAKEELLRRLLVAEVAGRAGPQQRTSFCAAELCGRGC